MFYTIDYSRKTKTYYLYQWRWSFVTGNPEYSWPFATKKEAIAKAKEWGLTKIDR